MQLVCSLSSDVCSPRFLRTMDTILHLRHLLYTRHSVDTLGTPLYFYNIGYRSFGVKIILGFLKRNAQNLLGLQMK